MYLELFNIREVSLFNYYQGNLINELNSKNAIVISFSTFYSHNPDPYIAINCVGSLQCYHTSV